MKFRYRVTTWAPDDHAAYELDGKIEAVDYAAALRVLAGQAWPFGSRDLAVWPTGRIRQTRDDACATWTVAY